MKSTILLSLICLVSAIALAQPIDPSDPEAEDYCSQFSGDPKACAEAACNWDWRSQLCQTDQPDE